MLREEMKKSARIGTALSEQLATVEKNLKLYCADMIAAQKAVIGPSAERGMIAVTPNIKMAMKAYIFAKNADSMRKRVNWIVVEYWSWEVRENLYFAPGQSTDLNKRVVTEDEIADIHCVCNILQEESPLQFDCESFEHDLLYWISRKLIVDRSRAKSGVAKCMQTMGAGAGDPNQHEPGADDSDDELSNADEDENTEKHDGDGTDVEDETQRGKDEGKETQRDADEDEQTQRDADEAEQTQRDPDEDEQTQRDADEETLKNGYEDEETLKDEYEEQEAPRIGFEDADTLVNKGEIEEAFSDDTNEVANGAKESIGATAQEQFVIEILGNVDEAEISTDDIVNQIQVLINEYDCSVLKGGKK